MDGVIKLAELNDKQATKFSLPFMEPQTGDWIYVYVKHRGYYGFSGLERGRFYQVTVLDRAWGEWDAGQRLVFRSEWGYVRDLKHGGMKYQEFLRPAAIPALWRKFCKHIRSLPKKAPSERITAVPYHRDGKIILLRGCPGGRGCACVEASPRIEGT